MRNYLHNSQFALASRGDTFTPAAGVATPVFDRWRYRRTQGGVTLSQIDGPAGKAVRIQRTAGGVTSTTVTLWQQIESRIARTLAGQYVTVAFDGLNGADQSAGAVSLDIITGTGVDEATTSAAFATGHVSAGNRMRAGGALTTTWTRYIGMPYLVPATATEMIIVLSYLHPATAAGAEDWRALTNFGLYRGFAAPPFEVPDAAAEALECRRHLIIRPDRAANGEKYVPFSPPMRATPTVTASVGTVSGVTKDGFLLTHTAAADCTLTASADL
ncbi:hypothetical protein ACRC7T_13815 [Segnochrobactraceae bacterium EtOH-i3]